MSNELSPKVQLTLRAIWNLERIQDGMEPLHKIKLSCYLQRRLIQLMFTDVVVPHEDDHEVYIRETTQQFGGVKILDHLKHPNIPSLILKVDWGQPWCPTWQTADFLDVNLVAKYYKENNIVLDRFTTPNEKRAENQAYQKELFLLGFEMIHLESGSPRVWIRGVESTFDRLINYNQYPESLPQHRAYYSLYQRYRSILQTLERENHLELGLSSRVVKALHDSEFTAVSVNVIHHRLRMDRWEVPICRDTKPKEELQKALEATRKRRLQKKQAKSRRILDQINKIKGAKSGLPKTKLLRDLALSSKDEEGKGFVEDEDSSDEEIIIKRRKVSYSAKSQQGLSDNSSKNNKLSSSTQTKQSLNSIDTGVNDQDECEMFNGSHVITPASEKCHSATVDPLSSSTTTNHDNNEAISSSSQINHDADVLQGDDYDAMSMSLDSDDEAPPSPLVTGQLDSNLPHSRLQPSIPFISRYGSYPTYPIYFGDGSFDHLPPFWWCHPQYAPPPRMVEDLQTGQICYINPL